MDENKKNIPTVIVIFGATGDLVQRKIFSSLFHLYTKGKLPRMLQIVGFARRDLDDSEFKSFARSCLVKDKRVSVNKDKIDAFLGHFSYQRGNFDNLDDYKLLAEKLGYIDDAWKVCANKLFYLAAPPHFYQTIFEHLSSSGLTIPCSPEEGWTRVIVEKPFGKDLETAKKLDLLLGKLFQEEQIYRIDHYLGKEMLQNVLSFRFANALFEDVWNNKYVEKIEVRILETSGLSARGEFYDGVGALRDVGQNHALQMLALVSMDRPSSFNAEAVREARADLLRRLRVLSVSEIKNNTFRGQFVGYNKLKGVKENSNTETYFKVITTFDSPRWVGVPIVIEGGKEMPEQIRDVVVTFKPSAPFFKDENGRDIFKNKVKFSLEPENRISVTFWGKKPGLELVMQEKKMNFSYRDTEEYAQEYERLLLDVINGNQLLFVSTKEVESMWSFIDPIVKTWEKDLTTLEKYQKRDGSFFERTPHPYAYIPSKNELKSREIGIVGLGRMGGGIGRRLVEYGWHVVGYNRSEGKVRHFMQDGGDGAFSFKELFEKLSAPRVIFVSLPHSTLEEMYFGKEGLINYMEKGDFLIDGANAFYKDTISYAKRFEKKGIRFVDVGVSGGPGGARYGASLMIGGNRRDYEYLKPLFRDMSVNQGEEFFEGAGAGHFVKMIHNGIEYGMMQAIAEGFDVLKNADFKLDLSRVASIYNHGSVIESRLIGWLEEAFEIFGQDLKSISGTVGHSGEGKWTIETASKMGIKVKVIEDALKYRIETERHPTYAGKILSALRNRFGGHSISDPKK